MQANVVQSVRTSMKRNQKKMIAQATRLVHCLNFQTKEMQTKIILIIGPLFKIS